MTDTVEHTVTVAAFKEAFRHHPAGVALVTAADADGPVGLTLSSVASVGIDPLALSFSVNRTSRSAERVLAAGSFLVHLLDARHVGVAQAFARTGLPRFTQEQGWTYLPTGEPYLPTVHAALRCHTLELVGVGTSVLAVCKVVEVLAQPEEQPAIWIDRSFRRVGDEPL